MVDKTRVLITGGGFGGLYAALQFERRRDPRFEITVVNRENFFLFTPMLHEIAASDLDLTNIVNPVRKMIRDVNFFCGDVDKIDIERKRVTVSHGFNRHSHELEYDHLVLGLGRIAPLRQILIRFAIHAPAHWRLSAQSSSNLHFQRISFRFES